MSKPVQLDLTTDEALVLFERLSQLDKEDAIPAGDPAEQQAFWNLLASLEKALPEILQEDYAERVEAAKSRLSGQDD